MLFYRIFDHLFEYFRSEGENIFIFSPFISNGTLEKLLSGIGNKRVTIITSWRSDHLLSGASNIDLYCLCKEHGWTLYINDNIHLKIYSMDLTSAFIGSANCTERGLKDSEGANVECVEYIETTMGDRVFLNSLLLSSILVDEETHNRYKDWIGKKERPKKNDVEEIGPTLKPMLLSYLPATKSLLELYAVISNSDASCEKRCHKVEHDMALFSICVEDSIETMREKSKRAMKDNVFISSFLDRIGEKICFGEATRWIHNECKDVPTPYRKDIKELVGNLFRWIAQTNDEYKLVEPNYSQCLVKTSAFFEL